jgi:acetyl esterase/lipase
VRGLGAAVLVLVLVLLLLLSAACSPTSVLNAVAPRAGVTLTRDVPYQDGLRHMLDVYAPRLTATPAPVVVFFYGGSWESGSKDIYRFVGAALAVARQSGWWRATIRMGTCDTA